MSDECRGLVMRDMASDEHGSRMHCAGCADAAALREQLGRVSNEILRLTNHVAHLGMDLATAEALALTNGEARGRAEARIKQIEDELETERAIQRIK